jgi:hypothetical protein
MVGGAVGEGAAGGPIDATLVLGDLAGVRVRPPVVVPFSTSSRSAPALLQNTVNAAIAQQAGLGGEALDPPGTLAQLAHLVFALPAGEQGPLGVGQPAVLVALDGEQPPPADEAVSAARLEGLGRAVLSAVYALDSGPELNGSQVSSDGSETGLPIQHKAIPQWALRLLTAALLLPALMALGDGLARARRRREPVGRWVLWALACALPFLACAAFALLLGRLGAIPTPRPPVWPAALPFDGRALEAVLATAFVLLLAGLGWPSLMRRVGLPVRPRAEAAALGMLLVLGALTLLVWVLDPLTALLLLPALNLWLVLAASPRVSAGRIPLVALSLVALGLVPLVLLVAFYAGQLDLGPGGVLHTALLLLAGGRVGVAGAVLWSVAFGCLAAALLVALAPAATGAGEDGGPGEGLDDYAPINIRGPLSYAGPGSLGGTESALRR